MTRHENPIFDWNRTIPESQDVCVHELIQQQVERFPDAEALCSSEARLSYRQLDQCSTLVARRLRALGVKPNTFVALSFEHSIWTAVAILAVWKAGAAFAPLPISPASRIEGILNQLESSIILCSQSRAASMMQYKRMCMTVDSRVRAESQQESFESSLALIGEVKPDDVAYAIFTSGSTGTPKGAQVEHRQFATYVKAWSRRMDVHQRSRVFNYSAYLFDVSISDIITPLCNGATLCVPSEDDRFNNITGSMRDMKVTHAEFVPSLLSTLDPKDFDLEFLKVVAVVGEKLPEHLLGRWNNIPGLRFVNSYGPAECCPHCCLLDTSTEIEVAANIGRSMASSLWIVQSDDFEKPLGVGEEGELVIEGPLVGRGYLKDPIKTAAAFPAAPSWLQGHRQGQSTRVYRTGDICRYNTNGTIEYVGRKDLQIKIRGQRMEVGEVEHHLRQALPDSDLAVDVGRTNGRDQLSLVAFIMLETSIAAGTAYNETTGIFQDLLAQEQLDKVVPQVQKYLGGVLPDYMIPTRYVAMHHIPRLASAKTDRKSLRALASEICSQAVHLNVAKLDESWTPVQQMLRTIWAKAFDTKEEVLTLDQDFFALGGDSITAIKMRLEVLKQGLQVTMQDIFQYPTILLLSEIASPAKPAGEGIAPFALVARDQLDAVKAVAAQQCQVAEQDIKDIFPAQMNVCWFMLSSDSVPGGWMHINAFPLAHEVNADRYLACWTAAINSHVNLRSRVVATQTTIYQVELKHDMETFRTATCSLDDYVQQEKSVTMKWGQSLSRYCLLQDPKDGQRYFVWSAKHAIYDDWSLQVLHDKISRAYATGDLSMEEELKPNAIVRNYQEGNMAPAKKWFKNYFLGSYPKPMFNIPTDYRYVKDAQRFWSISLPDPKTPPAYTLATIIGVAWALTLAQRIDTDDFILGLIRSGRNLPLPGVTEFMGPLTGLMPLRVRIDRAVTVQNLLQKYQSDWTESSDYDTYSWVDLCDDTNHPAVKGAVADPTTLNIVHDINHGLPYEVEVLNIDEGSTPADDHDDIANTSNSSATSSLLVNQAGSLLPVDSRAPSIQIDTLSNSESETSGRTSPASSQTSLSSAASFAPKSVRKHIRDLLPPVKEKNLGATQKAINLNVFLPQTGYDIRVMIRHDTTACRGEFADALVESFTEVAKQLLCAPHGMTVGQLEILNTRNVRASEWDA